MAELWDQWELSVLTVLAGILSSLPCAWLGCFLMLRRLSLMGDAISHAVLPGVVVAALLTGELTGWPIFLGAVVVGLFTAFLTRGLSQLGHVPDDAGMGVVFTSLFAVGVLLISQFASQVDLDPGCVLYGLIDFIPLDTVNRFGWEIPKAYFSLVPCLILTGSFVLLFWKELQLSSFDPNLASAVGFSADLIHYLLMALVAVVSVSAFEAVGSVLVVAMMIVPPATAHLLTDRLGRLVVIASLCCVTSSLFGYWGAIYWNTSTPGMMAVVAGVQFGLAVVFAPHHGLVSKGLHQLRLALRIMSEDIIGGLFRAEELAQEAGLSSEIPWRTCREILGQGRLTSLAFAWLRFRELIRPTPRGGILLTDEGRRRAQSLVRSHRLWEAYLQKYFHLPEDHLHAPAARLEHYIGPKLQEKLEEELDAPHTDPHGRQIP